MRRFSLAFVLALIWTTGAAAAQEPKAEGPTATLEFRRDRIDFGRSLSDGVTSNGFGEIRDAECKVVRRMGLGSAGQTIVKTSTAAGQRMVLRAASTDSRTKRRDFVMTHCSQYAGFVPAAGRTYVVTHRLKARGCELSVLDKETGEPAPMFTDLAGEQGCRDFLKGPTPHQ